MKFPPFEPINLKNKAVDLEVVELLLSEIISDQNQPRKTFDEVALTELSLSIKKYGVLQPIIVKKVDTNKYQIVAGERRWRASKMVGLSVIPAIIHNNNQQDCVAISLIENIQREQLNSIELAESFYKLTTEYGLSHEEIANMVGKGRTTISNHLRLLNLSGYVRDLLINGKIEMGHARALLTLPPENQMLFAKKLIEKNLSVRETEKLVQLYKAPKTANEKLCNELIKNLEKKFSRLFSSKATIKMNLNGTGKLIIHFERVENIDLISDQLNQIILD